MEVFIYHSCDEITSSKDPRDCIDCMKCNFIHLVNRPSQEQLDVFYRDEFFQRAKPNYAKEEQEDIAWHRMLFADRLEDFTELLGRKPESILDIGCGTGLFLGWLSRQKGVRRCVGIEPNTQAWKLALHSGDVILTESLDTSCEPFDVVVLQFVLEHVLDPVAMIRQAMAYLKPDGILYVCCPNDFTEIQYRAAKAIGKPYYWVHVPDHINYMNFDSLERLLLRCGLTPVLRDATFPMESFLLTDGFNYTEDSKLGRFLHTSRMDYELALDRADRNARRHLFRLLAMDGKGRDAIVFSKREAERCQKCDDPLTAHPEVTAMGDIYRSVIICDGRIIQTNEKV